MTKLLLKVFCLVSGTHTSLSSFAVKFQPNLFHDIIATCTARKPSTISTIDITEAIYQVSGTSCVFNCLWPITKSIEREGRRIERIKMWIVLLILKLFFYIKRFPCHHSDDSNLIHKPNSFDSNGCHFRFRSFINIVQILTWTWRRRWSLFENSQLNLDRLNLIVAFLHLLHDLLDETDVI